MEQVVVFAKVLACFIAGLIAPVVCLFYREGWFNTPDNPKSPHGIYEPFMQMLHVRFGARFADWWWLGMRNRAYGLRYALKPAFFKQLPSYNFLEPTRTQKGRVTVTEISGYTEYVVQLGWFHLIYGYRLTPIFDEVKNNKWRTETEKIPFRKINMDARPILSIRSGKAD